MQRGKDWHKQVITKGIHYASGNISNLQELLTYLTEKDVLTAEEFEIIVSSN